MNNFWNVQKWMKVMSQNYIVLCHYYFGLVWILQWIAILVYILILWKLTFPFVLKGWRDDFCFPEFLSWYHDKSCFWQLSSLEHVYDPLKRYSNKLLFDSKIRDQSKFKVKYFNWQRIIFHSFRVKIQP